MLHLLILICISFGGILCQDECQEAKIDRKCALLMDTEAVEAVDVVPDEADLLKICPGVLKFFRCFEEEMEDCGGMGEQALLDHVRSSHEIVKEICDENSDLHNAYVNSAQCYKLQKGLAHACMTEAFVFYDSYIDHLKKVNPVKAEMVERTSHLTCMTQSYKVACIAQRVLSECGEEASRTALEIISRSKFLRQFCSQSMVDEMKTTFLDQIQLEDEKKEVYEVAFNVIKK